MFGAEVTIGRLIPVHTICGVFMGYYLGCAKICERGNNLAECKRYRQLSLLIPILIHGAWDFCVSVDELLAFAIAMVSIRPHRLRLQTLHKYAKFDAPCRAVPQAASVQASLWIERFG